MNFNNFIDNVLQHYKRELPFVVYSLPDSDEVVGRLQKDSRIFTSDDLSERGFVMAPFDNSNDTFIIPNDNSEAIVATFISREEATTAVRSEVNFQNISNNSAEDKKNHIALVEKAIDTIRTDKATKIVLSRCKEIKLDKFDLSELVIRILQLYPTAFRYIWFHPKTGIWCGATPEVLIETNGDSFRTMALAGTQKWSELKRPEWSIKEIDEQEIVVDAIVNRLQKVTKVVKISKRYNHRAGSLAHLRTDMSGILNNKQATLFKLASTLHPTPAVCGSPLKIAKEFILNNEGYTREFYTGYLGPIGGEQNSAQLFVNLRSMKLSEVKATLFVGGGITVGSVPDEEWEETQNKLQTMMQVLQPLL